MSSWCRKAGPRTRAARVASLFATLTASVGVAQAAQTYIQPQVDVRAENNDNFDLVPEGSPDSDVYGFIVDAQALIGIATPRSDTSIRPRLKFQEYPDRDDLERVEAFLDMRSDYRWERSNFLFTGRYSRQDSYNADTPSGEFDPLDPNYGQNPGSVQVLLGETRTKVDLIPKYEYELNERVTLGAQFGYEIVRYDADGTQSNTDYDFAIVDGFARWALTPVSDVTVGAYASSYEAQDDTTETDAYGGRLGYDYRWSEMVGFEAMLFYEQNDTTDFVPVRFEDTTSNWGGQLTAYREQEVSSWRFTLSRKYIPTGDGGKAESDQLRLQYDRDLSERLSLRGAGRYESRNSLSTTSGGGADRDYARADLFVQWFMTETWYVRGGYSYIWVDRENASSSADNNQLFVSAGYRGLRRQRR
jgi:hypothetical protein